MYFLPGSFLLNLEDSNGVGCETESLFSLELYLGCKSSTIFQNVKSELPVFRLVFISGFGGDFRLSYKTL